VGGVNEYCYQEGYHLESGPYSVMLNNRVAWICFKKLDLVDSIIYPEEVGLKSRYHIDGKKAVALSFRPWKLLGNKVFGWGGNCHHFREPFQKPTDSADESLASFCQKEDSVLPF